MYYNIYDTQQINFVYKVYGVIICQKCTGLLVEPPCIIHIYIYIYTASKKLVCHFGSSMTKINQLITINVSIHDTE